MPDSTDPLDRDSSMPPPPSNPYQQPNYPVQQPNYPVQQPNYSVQQPGQPYGYYPPQPGPWGPPRPTNGMAVASMVLGILWIYWVGSVLALIFGYIAKKQIEERQEGGGGMATAGIVLGWVGVGILTVVLVIGLLGALGVFAST